MRWNFLAWCRVTFRSAKKPLISSAMIMRNMTMLAARSMGKMIRSSLNRRKPWRGSWSRIVSSQKPASSGTLKLLTGERFAKREEKN